MAKSDPSDRQKRTSPNPERQSEHGPARLEVDALRATLNVTPDVPQEKRTDDGKEEDTVVEQHQLQTKSRRQSPDAKPFWFRLLRFCALLPRYRRQEDEEQNPGTEPNT